MSLAKREQCFCVQATIYACKVYCRVDAYLVDLPPTGGKWMVVLSPDRVILYRLPVIFDRFPSVRVFVLGIEWAVYVCMCVRALVCALLRWAYSSGCSCMHVRMRICLWVISCSCEIPCAHVSVSADFPPTCYVISCMYEHVLVCTRICARWCVGASYSAHVCMRMYGYVFMWTTYMYVHI